MGTGMGIGMRLGQDLRCRRGWNPSTGLEHSQGCGEMGAWWEEQDTESCRLRGGCDSLGLLVPTWVSLLGSKPLAGASTRPRWVSLSGVSWFWSRNCREMSGVRRVGTPVPRSTPGVLLSPGLLSLAGSAGSQGSHHSPSALQGAAAAPRTGVSRAPRPLAPAPCLLLRHSMAVGAQCRLAPTAPTALYPRLLPALAKGVSQRSACPTVTRMKRRSSTLSSPGQAARRVRVYWFTRRASSSALARSVTCRGDTVLSGVPAGSCPALPHPAPPLPEMWQLLWGQR